MTPLITAPHTDLRAEEKSEYILRVNDRYVSRDSLGQLLKRFVGPEVIGQFLHMKLIDIRAEEAGISLSEEEIHQRMEHEVKKQLEDLFEYNRLTREEFVIYIRREGTELEQLRNQIRDTINEKELKRRLTIEKILAHDNDIDIDVTEAEVKRLFQWRFGQRIVAAHIQVADQETARQVYAYLRLNPGHWDEMVERVSDDKRSVPYNGRMLPFPSDTELGSAFADKKPEDMFVHQTERGWHVMKVINIFEEADVDFEEVKNQIEDEMYVRKAENLIPLWLEELRKEAVIDEPLGSENGVLAEVNGRQIMESEFEDILIQQYGFEYLPRVIERELIAQEAEKKGIEVAQVDVEKKRDKMTRKLFISEAFDNDYLPAEFEKELFSKGLSPDLYMNHIQQLYLDREGIETFLKAQRIALDRLISEEYTDNTRERASGPKAAVQRFTGKSREEIDQVRTTVENQGNLSKLVLIESDDPLAWLTCGIVSEITPEESYYEKIDGLVPGQLSEIFEEDGRYVFFMLLEKDDQAAKKPGEEIKTDDGYKKREAQRAIPALLRELEREAEIERYN